MWINVLHQAQLNNQKDQLKLELQEITKKMVKQFCFKCIVKLLKHLTIQAEFNEPKQLQSIDVSLCVTVVEYVSTS